MKLKVVPKQEVEKPWVDPNAGCFSSWWPLLGTRKLAPKKLKINFSLKAHAHYFTVFIYLETWRGAKLGIFYSFYLPKLTLMESKYELTDICILYTDPQQITDVIKLPRTTTIQKKFLYYPLMGLQFWSWNFHKQGYSFYSREVREFVRGFFGKSRGKVREENFCPSKFLTFKKTHMHAEMCAVELFMKISCIYTMLLFAFSIKMI